MTSGAEDENRKNLANRGGVGEACDRGRKRSWGRGGEP